MIPLLGHPGATAAVAVSGVTVMKKGLSVWRFFFAVVLLDWGRCWFRSPFYHRFFRRTRANAANKLAAK